MNEVTFADASLKDLALVLHPIQRDSVDAEVKAATFDPASGAFTVPGRTTPVFVLPSIQPTPLPTAFATSQPAGLTPTPMPSANPADFFTLNVVAVAFLVLSLFGFFLLRLRQPAKEEETKGKGKNRK